MFKRNCPYIVEQIVRPTGIPDPKIEIRPTENQLQDLIEEIKKIKAKGEKALILTTTKRFAENVAEFLMEKGIKAKFLHSDLNTVERTKVIKQLRDGYLDAIVGVNLLREGLDLPEVSLVLVLEADKEGFLRSFRSLIQIIGRAARHINGKAILYADKITPAIEKTVLETERRRKIQLEYNKTYGIKPKPVRKKTSNFLDLKDQISNKLLDKFKTEEDILKELAKLEKEMWRAANEWNFEKAALLRDKIKKLKELIGLV